MNVIDRALAMYLGTAREEWRQIGEAAVHRDCIVRNSADFAGAAICRGGGFYGGCFYGGCFYDGNFHSGNFYGGGFHGGCFYDGSFHGGYFFGGHFYDGNFHHGYFHDGSFHGGHFHGGIFHGGYFFGGRYARTPLHIVGGCNWLVTIGRPGEIAVGCECHTPTEWRERIDAIARKHGVDAVECARVMWCVEIAAQWLADNPDAVVSETEPQGNRK